MIKCKFCKRESTVNFVGDPGAVNAQKRQFQTIIQLDCRGVEPVDFDPRDGWLLDGVPKNEDDDSKPTTFDDVDLSDDFCDYDEKRDQPVSINGLQHRFEATK